MSNDFHQLNSKIDLLREYLHEQLEIGELGEEELLNISRKLDKYILEYYKTNNTDCK